jgi:membrane-associated phospholipid phosphatase
VERDVACASEIVRLVAPSGHATGAFAFASVIAGHYDSPWVATTATRSPRWSVVARIEQDAHWASDVVAGGLIGGLIGHHLVEFNETGARNTNSRRNRHDGRD